MSAEEMEFWKNAIQTICKAWIYGCIFLMIGIGSISIKNIFNKQEQSK